jgi:DNA-binding MarR family transcriptional regulator
MKHSTDTLIERLGITSYQTVITVNQSQKSLNSMLSTCLGHCGLSMMQWLVIGVLIEKPQKPMDIAKKIGITPPYVTAVLNQIKDMGFVTKTIVEDDGRSKIIIISDAGRHKAQEVEERLIGCIKREMGDLNGEELMNFLKVSNYIAQTVRHR